MEKELLKSKFKRLLFSGVTFEIAEQTEKCKTMEELNHRIEIIRKDYNSACAYLDEEGIRNESFIVEFGKSLVIEYLIKTYVPDPSQQELMMKELIAEIRRMLC